MFSHSWPRSERGQATPKIAGQQKAMSCAISSPTHGLGTVMEIATQNSALRTPLNQGAANKIDTKSSDLHKCFHLCHIAASFP